MWFPTPLSLPSGDLCRPGLPQVEELESYITNVDEFDEASITVSCQLCISPGEPAGSDTTRKFCITNLDELAEANLTAFYKMIILKTTLPNEPAPSSQLRQPALMKLFWILSNQVLVQILCSILSSWQTTWTILVWCQPRKNLKSYQQALNEGDARLEELWEFMEVGHTGQSSQTDGWIAATRVEVCG